LQISCQTANRIEFITITYIVKSIKNKKGKPIKMDLPLLKRISYRQKTHNGGIFHAKVIVL